jgi:uncharacterized membrane protein YhaH (DUF805 family)
MNYYLKVLQNYANFNGRARRAEYWYFFLFNVIFAFTAMSLDNVAGLANDLTGYGPISGLYVLFAFIPGLAVAVRRMHDIGKSGWMILVGLIPVICLLFLILAATKGNKGENEYGQDPKGESSSDLLDA